MYWLRECQPELTRQEHPRGKTRTFFTVPVPEAESTTGGMKASQCQNGVNGAGAARPNREQT